MKVLVSLLLLLSVLSGCVSLIDNVLLPLSEEQLAERDERLAANDSDHHNY